MSTVLRWIAEGDPFDGELVAVHGHERRTVGTGTTTRLYMLCEVRVVDTDSSAVSEKTEKSATTDSGAECRSIPVPEPKSGEERAVSEKEKT